MVWRRDEGTEQDRRWPGTEGQQLGMAALSPVCLWSPCLAAAAAPLSTSRAGSSPREMGGKAGSTWVLLPLD